MNLLYQYINQYTSLSIDEFDELQPYFISKQLKKKEFLLEKDQISNFMAFICKGSMRKYQIDAKGTEHVVNLFIEGWWAGDRESFVKQSPSNYFIETCEECEVLLLSRENTIELKRKSDAFRKLLSILDENNIIANQKRISETISMNAEQKYVNFSNDYPHFVNRFHQHIIASYLGITKDTLSRIRKKALKNRR